MRYCTTVFYFIHGVGFTRCSSAFPFAVGKVAERGEEEVFVCVCVCAWAVRLCAASNRSFMQEYQEIDRNVMLQVSRSKILPPPPLALALCILSFGVLVLVLFGGESEEMLLLTTCIAKEPQVRGDHETLADLKEKEKRRRS